MIQYYIASDRIKTNQFLKAIDLSKEKLITFGIIPNSPENDYGHIKSDKPFNNDK